MEPGQLGYVGKREAKATASPAPGSRVPEHVRETLARVQLG